VGGTSYDVTIICDVLTIISDVLTVISDVLTVISDVLWSWQCCEL